METRATHFIQLSNQLELQNWMEDKTPTFSPTSKCSLTSYLNFFLKILNGSKSREKGFGLVIIKIPKTNIIITLWKSYYIPQNPQNTISKTTLKYYNPLKSIITEAMRWFKITTYTGNKIKAETEAKEIYQKLLYLIKIETIKVEHKISTTRNHHFSHEPNHKCLFQ